MCLSQFRRIGVAIGVSLVGLADPASAQSPLSGDELKIARLTGPVTIDGSLGDDAWRGAEHPVLGRIAQRYGRAEPIEAFLVERG